MLTTQKWFNLSIDELLETNEAGYTKEENLLFDSGVEVIFHDNIEEMKAERETVQKYVDEKGYEVKWILKTINERIAIVLI